VYPASLCCMDQTRGSPHRGPTIGGPQNGIGDDVARLLTDTQKTNNYRLYRNGKTLCKLGEKERRVGRESKRSFD